MIGGGVAGLSCAYELVKHGVSVQLLEREQTLGGRMSTRLRSGLAFDRGASFLVRVYRQVCGLAEELGIPLHCLSPVEHAIYRDGKPRVAHLASMEGLFQLECLSGWGRLRFFAFLARIRTLYPSLDFFDLSTVPEELNQQDAYTVARRQAGREFADYVAEGFNAAMMFYRTSELSSAAFLSLFRMMVDPASNFSVLSAEGQMQSLPDALGRKVPHRLDHPVRHLQRLSDAAGWLVDGEPYDIVVLATTAGAARQLVPLNLEAHRRALDAAKYAATLNVSFRVPQQALGKTHCFYVPFVESALIAEFTNESLKRGQAVHHGWSLVNVGLHEAAARELLQADDITIFDTVRTEFLRLFPLKPELVSLHDLQRWPEAIPKYTCDHVRRVKQFQSKGQGEEGLYLCGDWLNAPWLEGASRSGTAVAQQIIRAVVQAGGAA